MPSSTTRGYPYPVPADPATGPAAIQALASAIDADVSATVPGMLLTSLGDTLGSSIAGDGVAISLGSGDASIVQFVPKVTVSPTKAVWICDTQSGNYDLGICRVSDRANLWSTGASACPAPGEVIRNITNGLTLTAGVRYAFVFATDNGTLEYRGCGLSNDAFCTLYDGTVGIGLAWSSYPIPATVPVWTSYSAVPYIALRA